jgi:very-short-patch-repair endonuclease
MERKVKNKLTSIARKLRKNMTDAELKLWYHLRNKQMGVKFRRQCPIGNYIVDFVSYEARLAVEVDGGQHSESESDKARDGWIESQGFKVLRFWNNEVLGNIEGVLDMISQKISPSPNPSHQGRGI